MSAQRDWRIVLEPQKMVPELEDVLVGGSSLEIIFGDEEDAIDALEGWAETFERVGHIPRGSLDWQNEAAVGVVRRMGKRTYYIRCDTFEAETDTGYLQGFGYMKVVPA